MRTIDEQIVDLLGIRDSVLRIPGGLTGNVNPSFDIIWGYCQGLTDSIELLRGNNREKWDNFIKSKKWGMRTEYRIALDKYKDNNERRKFLRDLYVEYEKWLLEGSGIDGLSEELEKYRVYWFIAIGKGKDDKVIIYAEDGTDNHKRHVNHCVNYNAKKVNLQKPVEVVFTERPRTA